VAANDLFGWRKRCPAVYEIAEVEVLARLAAIPLAAVLTSCAGPRPRPAPPIVGAPVVVAVVVDQLAAWVAAERLPLLPDGGGFARLRREGTWVKDMAYLHAVTETAPGHASLFTGRTPRETGVVGNAVWRDDLGRAGSLIEDPGAELVGADGRYPGVSLALLRQKTVADALLERDPRAVVVALSLKDRGAVFAGGRTPAASIWYDEREGVFVTSTAFARRLPAWAAPHARPLAKGALPEWNVSAPAFIARNVTTPDDQAGENTMDLGGSTFPHALSAAPSPSRAFRAMPDGDSVLVDLALAAVDAERRPDHAMLLGLSFSVFDYVGHWFGPDSWEAWDELVRLDAALGRLLAGLDARLGEGGYAVVLTGDHGIVSLPEVVSARTPAWCGVGAADPYERPCAPGARLVPGEIGRRLEEAVRRELGTAEPTIGAVVEALVYLTPRARRATREVRGRIDAVVRREAAAIPGLAAAVPIADLGGECPPPADETLGALVCRATARGVGDYYLVPAPGSFFWWVAPGATPEGTSHGSPYRYDRTVPLLVRYPRGARGAAVARAVFGSYYASVWYALTGEVVEGPFGGVIGRGP